MRAKADEVQELELCLEQIEAFAGEIDRAIRAIAGNSVEALERSVEQQRELSPRLVASVRRAQPAQGADDAATRALRLRVGGASQRLRCLNQRYAALLAHSGRSLRMLQALYNPAAVAGSPAALLARTAQPACSWEG